MKLSISLQNNSEIRICAENDLSPDIDLQYVEEKLAEKRALIDAGSHEDLLRSEGGTGLVKLSKASGRDPISGKARIEFGLRGRNVYVLLHVPATLTNTESAQ
jgi:hypothetical protein